MPGEINSDAVNCGVCRVVSNVVNILVFIQLVKPGSIVVQVVTSGRALRVIATGKHVEFNSVLLQVSGRVHQLGLVQAGCVLDWDHVPFSQVQMEVVSLGCQSDCASGGLHNATLCSLLVEDFAPGSSWEEEVCLWIGGGSDSPRLSRHRESSEYPWIDRTTCSRAPHAAVMHAETTVAPVERYMHVWDALCCHGDVATGVLVGASPARR